jgi:ABC-type bacteriocin/lantibiotic exporter with double-glycine peptidase domain
MRQRRLLAPEVVQISSTDCGPAALKCMLEGYGIPVSYGRLREACQTDVDGTSIDTLEELARHAGLDAAQTMLPVDHILLPEAEALPAILVVRLPSGLTHFLVIWSRLGGLVQVMDPITGRRWTTCERLLRETYIHTTAVPADSWRQWAGSSSFLRPLERRLLRIGFVDSGRRRIEEALSDPTWRSLGELDAGVRMMESVLQAGGLKRGRQTAHLLEGLLEQSRQEPLGHPSRDRTIPGAYWSVLQQPDRTGDPSGQVLRLRGAVVLTICGRLEADEVTVPAAVEPPTTTPEKASDGGEEHGGMIRSLEIAAALAEPPARPWRELLRFLRADGAFTPIVLLGASALASATILLEALLFRSLLGVGRYLRVPGQRLPASVLLIAYLSVVLLLEFAVGTDLQRLGRKLETRLRIAFLEKLPRLNDRYIQSRPTSDMADRCHSVHRLRLLPPIAGQFLRDVFELTFTAAGIVWLDPASAPAALTLAAISVALPVTTQPLLAERDLRVRSHASALSRFYLDALLGLTPIRTHGAERAVRREHEGLLVEWTRAGRSLLRGALAVEGVTALVSFALAAWLFIGYVRHAGEASGALLLLYWALNLPVLGQGIATTVRQYPSHRNVALRLLEPLGALEGRPIEAPSSDMPFREAPCPTGSGGGIAIRLEGVSVVAAGHTILQGIDLMVSPGEHVAVVGASGAGKSTLLGLFLGWHRPASGVVFVDGLPLDAGRLDSLRSETAWVDPAVQLWNRSLLENLTYGESDAGGVAGILDSTDLRHVLENLPDGLQTVLGEGGGLVSGGEGQRVRLGRAMVRRKVRLVLLDEPFRSLDRGRRRALLARARSHWAGVTLLCITHDISETVGFDRVLVVDGGKIVEDDAPATLTELPDSLYRLLLDTETAVQQGLWSSTTWRRFRVEHGQIFDASEA